MPNQTQLDFLQVATDHKILKFGKFTLKSGRKSPYFFNAGLFNTGSLLSSLCDGYTKTITESGIEFDVIFGPAYKGIPLAAVTAAKLSQAGHDKGYAFNRKEAKAHGEGGNLVGASLQNQRVLIIDDVMTAGTAIREAIAIIKAQGGTLAGVVVALDRQERGTDSELSTVRMVETEFGIKVHAIVTFADIIEFSKNFMPTEETQAMEAYRKVYGIN